MNKPVEPLLTDEAREWALTRLDHRAYSSHDLFRRLLEVTDEETAETVIGQLTGVGLLNDQDYARRLACNLLELRLWGPLRLAQELSRRGITPEQVDDAIAEAQEETGKDVPACLRLLLERRFRGALSDDEREKRRAVNALLRMGYRYDEIRAAVAAWEEEL